MNWTGLAITLAASLACGMAGAWGYNHFAGRDANAKGASKGDDKQKSGDPSKQGGQAPGQADAGDQKPSKVAVAASNDVDSINKQIQYLNSRFDSLQQKLSAISIPRDTNPPDLEALKTKVDELSRMIHSPTSRPEWSDQIQARLDRLQEDVKSIRAETTQARADRGDRPDGSPAAEPARVTGPVRNPPPPPDASAESAVSPSTDESLAPAVALFKKKDYARADEAFRLLRLSRPQDARVWYWSALAHGFASGDWEGETRRFVVNGADQEKASQPPSSRIDAAFADLTAAQGKDWLGSYRSQLVKP